MNIRHVFTNPVPDGTITSIVRPSDWNSAHVQSLIIGGNTAGVSSWSGSELQLNGGPNLTISLNGNTLVFSGGAGGGGGGAALSAGTQSVSTGTVAFANSNGITFGMSGSSQITASHNGLTTARASNDAIGLNTALTANGVSMTANSSGLSLNFPVFLTTGALSNHSHGNPTLALTNLSGTTASASNGLTLSLSAAAQSAQTIGVIASSQTVGQSSSSTVDARSLSIRGMGVASVGMSAGELIISVPAGGGAGDGVNALVVNGGASTASTTLTLSNSNNVTFGHAGGVITASASFAQSVQTQSNVQGISAGTQVGRTGDIVLANSNGISFGMSGSSQVTASYTVPSLAGLLSAINVSAGTTSNNLSALTFANGNGVTFGLNASTLTASVAAQTVQTQNLVSIQGSTGAISFSNSNGITFGFNASTITASHNGLTSQSNQAVSAANGSSTFQTLSFANSNGISFGTAVGGLTASHNGLTTAAASDHSHGNPTLALTNLSGTTASNSAGFTLSLSAAAGGGGGITNINVSAGTTSQNLSNLVFSNSNGVTFGLNGSTLTASVAAGGGGGTLSMWEPSAAFGNLTTLAPMGQGSLFVMPMELPCNLSFSRADHFVTMGISSSSNSSHAGAISLYLGLYTRNGSTLSLGTSASQSYQWTNTSSNSNNSLTGMKALSVPLAANLTPGDYWIGVMSRSTTTNANWFTANNMRHSAGTMVLRGLIGQNISTGHRMPGFGMFTATTSALPASVAFTQIAGQGAAAVNSMLAPHLGLFNISY